ncbi:beta-lactamase family protein [Acholeplasma sp. OttesenSCG-928-E16]|nr:beta-lactamase family protein [Acholeplasma sp. OttesenSCG-928-E16]
MIQKIQAIAAEAVNKKDIPGASFALVKNGIIETGYVGYKQIYKRKIKNRGNEVYDCASLTKVISTTTIIMKLIEDKKLRLDDFVSDFLPRFKHKNITIYHLLTHSSGLPADVKRSNTLKSKEEVMDYIYDVSLINDLETSCVYSDIGFILLGEIIEKITNKKISENAFEMIFKPLNMISSSYYPDKRFAAPTELREDDVYNGLLRGMVHDEKSFAMKGEAGHAGLFSNVYDISLFIKAILEDKFVLKKETVDELFKHRPLKSNNETTRALGWDKPQKGGQVGDNFDFINTICHTGFTGCNMFIDRKRKIGFVMLSNAVHYKRAMNHIFSYRYRIGSEIIKKGVEG